MIEIAWNQRMGRFRREDGLLTGTGDGKMIPMTKNCRHCPYFYTDVKSRCLVDVKGLCFRESSWKVVAEPERMRECEKLPQETKMVSFRIRKIYYDQFVSGEKTEELRAYNSYWIGMLLMSSKLPTMAAISCGPHPTLYFSIAKIFIDRPENILGRPLSEQGIKDLGAKDSTTTLCIATKMGVRVDKKRKYFFRGGAK